jgi:SAM-dependent methyltransferase
MPRSWGLTFIGSYRHAHEYRTSRPDAYVRSAPGSARKDRWAIMARMNRGCVTWVITDVLRILPNDSALEVGFGPGVGIECLVKASAAKVARVDASDEMVGQARARNANALAQGGVDLRLGSVERLPFDDHTFDAALAINSMQVWPDPVGGLREIRRVLKRSGRIALASPDAGRRSRGCSGRHAERSGSSGRHLRARGRSGRRGRAFRRIYSHR